MDFIASQHKPAEASRDEGTAVFFSPFITAARWGGSAEVMAAQLPWLGEPSTELDYIKINKHKTRNP